MNMADKLAILVTGDPILEARKMLEKVGVVSVCPSIKRKDLLARVRDVDAIIGGGKFDETFFRAAPRLKIISIVGVGYDNVDLDAATKHRVIVTNTPGVMAEAVAEHAILLMLACARNLVSADRELRDGFWNWEKNRGIELWGRTLGQIGFGHIGSLVAKKANRAFNMHVLVFDPLVNKERVVAEGAEAVGLHALLREADIINISVPLNEETRHLISQNELSLMKPTCVLVNTARGGVIHEKALIAALKNRRIAAAGLDVFENEPLPAGSPIVELKNVVLTPHLGSNTNTGIRNMFLKAARNVCDVLLTGEADSVLNPGVINGSRKSR